MVCRREKGEWVKGPVSGVWSVVAKRASGSRELSLACGLSGRKRCVGQGACRRRVVCRGENAAWVKRPVGGVWSVVAKRASGSKGLSLACGLSGENAVWVKEIVVVVWSDGSSLASGSRELSVACGLSGENAAWVKKASGVVWFSGRNRRVGQKAC